MKMVNQVNNVLNGNLAGMLKTASTDRLEKVFQGCIDAINTPEAFMGDKEYIISMIEHCQLVFAQELKNRYNKISESN